MRLPDDDEVYEVDGTYLGPPGRTIGRLRYKAVGVFLALGPLLAVILTRIGFHWNFLTGGLFVIVMARIARSAADHITYETPIAGRFITIGNELRAAREQSITHIATGANFATMTAPPKGVQRLKKKQQKMQIKKERKERAA